MNLNNCFEIDNIVDVVKVKLAAIYFVGKALHWLKYFLSIREKGKLVSWSEFVEVLVARFGEHVVWDTMAEIKKLKQEGSLQQYPDEFDVLLSQTYCIET